MNVKWPASVGDAQRDALNDLMAAELRERRPDGGAAFGQRDPYHGLIRRIIAETDATRIPRIVRT